MKVKVPPINKIGHLKYRISFQENLKNDEAFRGCCNHRTQAITVDPVMVGEQRDIVLCHEVLHQICENYEIKLEESDIGRIASGFSEFVVDNLGIEFDWSEIKEPKQE